MKQDTIIINGEVYVKQAAIAPGDCPRCAKLKKKCRDAVMSLQEGLIDYVNDWRLEDYLEEAR